MNTELQSEITVAAQWWANQLRGKPSRNALLGEDAENALEKIMASMSKDTPTNDQIALFAQSIIDLINRDEYYGYISLSVDYHPCDILQKAAQNAGIELGMSSLPWKTQMYIEKNSVRVKEGYGAEMINLMENHS